MLDAPFLPANKSFDPPLPGPLQQFNQPDKGQPPEEQTHVPAHLIGTHHEPIQGLNSPIDELRTTMQFIEVLRSATLDSSNMRPEDVERLHAAEPDPLRDAHDKHFVKAFKTFLSTTNSSQATYHNVRSSMLECYPDDPFLSYDQIKRCIEQLSGMVLIFHDMCEDTCIQSRVA
jgi:hypothetical protein